MRDKYSRLGTALATNGGATGALEQHFPHCLQTGYDPRVRPSARPSRSCGRPPRFQRGASRIGADGAVPDPLKQRTQELEALRNEQKKAAETTERLQREVEAIGEDRRKLSASLIETAGRVRMVEDRIAGGGGRLQPLGDKERALRASLDKRRASIAEVLAALQRMGRRPPPAIVVRPEDALEAVRSAILLGAVVPDMRNEAASIATDLSDLVHLRADITAEREKLAGDLAALVAGTLAHGRTHRRAPEAASGGRNGPRRGAAAGIATRSPDRQSQGFDQQTRAGPERVRRGLSRRRRILAQGRQAPAGLVRPSRLPPRRGFCLCPSMG